MSRNLWYQCYPRDELADAAGLNGVEFGFLIYLRRYSLCNEGIPDDGCTLRRLANALQISRYKFKQIWPRIVKYFTLVNGVYYHEEDQRRWSKVVDISDKCKVSGRLGAEARWSKHRDSAESGVETAMAIAIGPPDTRYIQRAAALSTGVEAAAAAACTDSTNNTSNLADIEALTIRSHELGMAAPTSVFAAKMRAKFLNVDFRTLPLFPGQRSVGLWLQKSEQDIRSEIERQHPPPDRKPPAKEGPPPNGWIMDNISGEQYYARDICDSKNRNCEPGHKRYKYRSVSPYLDQGEWLYPCEIVDTNDDTVIEVVTHRTILNRGKKSCGT
jgi:hypothetical protein